MQINYSAHGGRRFAQPGGTSGPASFGAKERRSPAQVLRHKCYPPATLLNLMGPRGVGIKWTMRKTRKRQNIERNKRNKSSTRHTVGRVEKEL